MAPFNIEQDKTVRRLGRRMLKVYKDQETEATRASEGTSCRKGCSACCHSIVMVSLPEAVAVAEHAFKNQNLWMNDLEVLLAKLYRQTEILGDPSSAPDDDSLGLPCVFLDQEEQTCTVYDARPSACRYHHVTSHPDACDPRADETPVPMDLSKFQTVAQGAAKRVARQVGTPLGLAPMAVSVLWAFKALTEGKAVLSDSSNPELGVLSLKFWNEALGTPDVGSTIILTDLEENDIDEITEEEGARAPQEVQ